MDRIIANEKARRASYGVVGSSKMSSQWQRQVWLRPRRAATNPSHVISNIASRHVSWFSHPSNGDKDNVNVCQHGRKRIRGVFGKSCSSDYTNVANISPEEPSARTSDTTRVFYRCPEEIDIVHTDRRQKRANLPPQRMQHYLISLQKRPYDLDYKQ